MGIFDGKFGGFPRETIFFGPTAKVGSLISNQTSDWNKVTCVFNTQNIGDSS